MCSIHLQEQSTSGHTYGFFLIPQDGREGKSEPLGQQQVGTLTCVDQNIHLSKYSEAKQFLPGFVRFAHHLGEKEKRLIFL